MQIKDIEKIEKIKGTASTIKASDLIHPYAEGVEKFLRDNQSSMGDEWVKSVGSRLYRFNGTSSEGDIIGSSIDMGVAIATFCPEFSLITGEQLYYLYKQAGDKNPFGGVYIDFGVQINGEPHKNPENPEQTRTLLSTFENRGINIANGRVLDFNQLKLIADQDAVLVYKLAEDVSEENIAHVSDYPFEGRVGKNGLFGAFLGGNGDWFAEGDNLPYSNDEGRMVCYDAEGVAPKKSRKQERDLVTSLTKDFLERF